MKCFRTRERASHHLQRLLVLSEQLEDHDVHSDFRLRLDPVLVDVLLSHALGEGQQHRLCQLLLRVLTLTHEQQVKSRDATRQLVATSTRTCMTTLMTFQK